MVKSPTINPMYGACKEIKIIFMKNLRQKVNSFRNITDFKTELHFYRVLDILYSFNKSDVLVYRTVHSFVIQLFWKSLYVFIGSYTLSNSVNWWVCSSIYISSSPASWATLINPSKIQCYSLQDFHVKVYMYISHYLFLLVLVSLTRTQASTIHCFQLLEKLKFSN